MNTKIVLNIFGSVLFHLIVSSSEEEMSSKSAVQAVQGSSLVFVFDTTGSMNNDLKQLREGAELILDTVREASVISDFVLVPFHDPSVGPPTVTKDKSVFREALNRARDRQGGGDCPEKALSGILMALRVSLPRSYVYVFTDATAGDHHLVDEVLDLVQRKQSQITFVLTGHCNDVDKPPYQVYQRVAAASGGQVFNLHKTSVHSVLDFVRTSIKGKTVNLGSAVNIKGQNYTREIPIDKSLGEVTVSVSGVKPQISVVAPSGQQVRSPQLITSLDLAEIMVVKVLEPEPGNWTINVGSDDSYSVKVVGLSNLTFNHGFSTYEPHHMTDTSLRPLQGTPNYMMITLSQPDLAVSLTHAEILSLEGKVFFEIPLKLINNSRLYLAESFTPPEDYFYIAINGRDELGQELRRVGATAVKAKTPDLPYITLAKSVKASAHESVALCCQVESLVPLKVTWAKGGQRLNTITTLQSTVLEYVIRDVNSLTAGEYRCVAQNQAGIESAYVDVVLLEPPELILEPENKTVLIGEQFTFSCSADHYDVLTYFVFIFEGTKGEYFKEEANLTSESMRSQPVISRAYIADDHTDGIYTCVASNAGGQTTKSSLITVLKPKATIEGPKIITKELNSDLEMSCAIEHGNTLMWVSPDGTIRRSSEVKTIDKIDLLSIRNLMIEDGGLWTCVIRNAFGVESSDSINLIVRMDPNVTVNEHSVTVQYGSSMNITCTVKAVPKPGRMFWQTELGIPLESEITTNQNNVYTIELKFANVTEKEEGRYYCNAGDANNLTTDVVYVRVKKYMKLIEGFSDKTVQLHSKVTLNCKIDSYPKPLIIWFHNNSEIQLTEVKRDGNENYTIEDVRLRDTGLYECKAINSYERIVVKGTLTVVNLEAPLLWKEPQKIIGHKGKPIIVTCRVLKGNPKPRITWQRKDYESEVFTDITEEVTNFFNGSQLRVANVNDSALYRCMADNEIGADLYEVDVQVQYAPQIKLNHHHNESRPIEVKSGGKVRFKCDVTGRPLPLVLWTKDGHPIVFTDHKYLTDTNELILDEAYEFDSGVYTCTVSNDLGSDQRNFTLIVYVPPSIRTATSEPDLEVLEGQLVKLACPAQGHPTPSLKWRHNGMTIQNGGRKYVDEDNVLRFVANLTDIGEYICVATNRYGNSSIKFNVYVWAIPYIKPPLEMRKKVLIGQDINLQCDAVGFPIPSIVWLFEGELLESNTTSVSFNDVGNIYLKNVTSEVGGSYSCVAENGVGIARKKIQLDVFDPPRILQDNYTGSYIATDKDAFITILCTATGKPKPNVSWNKDGIHLVKSDAQYNISEGSLTIVKPRPHHSGAYVCLASNEVGAANKNFNVKVLSFPKKLQSDVTEVTVIEGTNETIHCPISCNDNCTLKWYKDAKLMSQGDLNLTNTKREISSLYACTMTNSIGSAMTTVKVKVKWPPKFTNNVAKDISVIQGDNTNLDCSTDANPVATTKWFFNSKQLLDEDKETLRLLNVKIHRSGLYACAVSNQHGTVTREFVLDVYVPPFISQFDIIEVPLKEGANATLKCDAKGVPTPNISWTFNDTNILNQTGSLNLINVTVKSSGIYRCMASNMAGVARLTYKVTAVKPATVIEVIVYDGDSGTTVDESCEVMTGSTIRVSCRAAGTPTPRIQWINNGNTVAENSMDMPYTDMVLSNISSSDFYNCLASNIGGTDEKKVQFEVLEPPKISTSQFEEFNTNKTKKLQILSGQPFHLHCHPYGNPAPQIYWFRNGTPLKLFDKTMVSSDFNEIISTDNAKYDQVANYTCVARNKVGQSFVSYLVDVMAPPLNPKDVISQIMVIEGRDITLRCEMSGNPAPLVSWYKQPDVLVTGDLSPRITLKDDNCTLTITNSSRTDAGTYSYRIRNDLGLAVGRVVLRVGVPPTAHSEGGALVPLKGGHVAVCQLGGEPAPYLRWYKDAKPITSNSSNIQLVLNSTLLTIWSAETRDAGVYTCVAENVAGVGYMTFTIQVMVPGKLSPWSQWGLCNVTCGLGYQHRARSCQYSDDFVTIDSATNGTTSFVVLDETGCKGARLDKRKCHLAPCEDPNPSQPRWSSWSHWSQCSAQCGEGTQIRTRKCKPASTCHGDNVQIRKCPKLAPCPTDQNEYDAELIPENNEFYNVDTEDYADLAGKYYEEFKQSKEDLEEGYGAKVSDADVGRLYGKHDAPCGPGYEYYKGLCKAIVYKIPLRRPKYLSARVDLSRRHSRYI